ncbi:MAG TPA: FtsK/SpoIIIE domain-containing protein, partial [Rugosimonospora sp.]|nr:FtsK/SpoIIIE domain-containing protein [Rugosimonospora sp.]
MNGGTAVNLFNRNLFRRDAAPAGAAQLSMFDPLFIGMDEYGHAVTLDLVFHNLLVAGEPGGGKSVLLNNIAATATMAQRTRLVLFDGKVVELGPYREVADEFVPLDLEKAISVLKRLLRVALDRYVWLLSQRRRKVSRFDDLSTIVTIIDELAMFTTVLGEKKDQELFASLLRGLVAIGRACGMPVVAATQRPSFDIVPTSLRDLFGYRAAFRCTTLGSSDVILGQGWAAQGFNAVEIDPDNRGEAFLLAEGGTPYRI